MKTMKRFALAAVAAIVSMTMNAQDALVATLQHGDNMQAFYGGNALKQALEAAQQGDVISLSAGTFASTDITKAVTIQGAGYVQDAANSRYRTTINGSLKIDLPEGQKGLVIEGLHFPNDVYIYNNIENLMFRKCLLYQIDMRYNNCVSKNCTFDQCRIKYFFPDSKALNLLLQNCIIGYGDLSSQDASLLFNHCVLVGVNNSNTCIATYKNCLISNNWNISPYSTYHYNVIYSSNSPTNGENNIKLNQADFKALFADGEYTYTEERTYELTAAAAQQHLGTDGTQVGIYGGDTPFTDVPTNPQITSRQIATKTNSDGKLSVKITVEAQK